MRSDISEYETVEKAAEKFVKSMAEGNSEYARELFVDEAVLFGYLDGDLEPDPSSSSMTMLTVWPQVTNSMQEWMCF